MNSNFTTDASVLNANERKRVLNILESNWQAEMRGCPTYEQWAERIHVVGGSEPTYQGPKAGEAKSSGIRDHE